MDAWPRADCQGRGSISGIFDRSWTPLPVRKAELPARFRFLNPQPPPTGIWRPANPAAFAVNAGGICADKSVFPHGGRLIDKI
jgi:hypothetical protein